jgi:poly-beta-1,6-N-acetyl-D-glucosamine synthase
VTATGMIETLYWIGAGSIAYPYVVYPALLATRARFAPRPVRRAEPGASRPSVSVVIAAFNEEAAIARRVGEFCDRIAALGSFGEIVVVSDGSTDDTARAALAAARNSVTVRAWQLPTNVGKAAALTVGCTLAKNEIIVFADARQTWAADALERLLENFADPEVGAVSGELCVESSPGVMAGVGLYWRYEKALRRMEGLVHSTVGLTGSICAVRRALFCAIPPGTVLDDVYWPLRVVMNGHRVVFDDRARAFDRLPGEVAAEFRRKVRTLAGVYQLAARLPSALLPGTNPVWFAFWSHKLMRLVVPWAWIAVAFLAAARGGPWYLGLLGAQLAVTAVGLLGLFPKVAARSKLAAGLGSFLMLNAAAWVAFWVWATGRTARSWTKTTYREPDAPARLEGAAS